MLWRGKVTIHEIVEECLKLLDQLRGVWERALAAYYDGGTGLDGRQLQIQGSGLSIARIANCTIASPVQFPL